MSSKSKKIAGGKPATGKSFPIGSYSSDGANIIWTFDRIDRDGPFAFDLSRPDFNHKEVLTKIVEYSSMTWSDVKSQTHDRGKSKHHFLNVDSLSNEARERVTNKLAEEEYDQIFSFAFQNKLRVVGIRVNEVFHIIWYDPEHKFCPSSK